MWWTGGTRHTRCDMWTGCEQAEQREALGGDMNTSRRKQEAGKGKTAAVFNRVSTG